MKPNSNRTFYWLQLFAWVLGIALSFYLLVQHTRLKSGIQVSASFCSLGGFADCDVVNVSPFSELGGIPLAAIGAIYYFVFLLLGVMAPPGDKNFRFFQVVMARLTVLGLGIDIVLFLIQVVSLRSLCIMCFGTYLATFLGFAMNVVLANPAGGESKLRETLIRPKARSTVQIPGIVLSLGAFALVSFVVVVALTPYYIRLSSRTYENVEAALEKYFQTWKDKPARTIDLTDGDGTKGNPNARIHIVEFSDFECPFCRRAAFTLHAALQPLESRIFFDFKNFPLDSSCNPALSYQLHQHACNLARLGYCAQKKGKFWEYHDLVFLRMHDDDFKTNWSSVAEQLRPVFTLDEISQCLQDEKSLQAVSETIKQGNTLGVRGTPTIYINGKQVSSIPLTVDTIRKLISLEEGS